MGFGSFLIEYKNEKILLDLGIGDTHISTPEGDGDGGNLLKNLKKVGLDRKDITKIIYSHFHPGNVGWTSMEENGKRVLKFPNAEYYCSENEWDFWSSKIGEPLSIDAKTFKEPLEGFIKFVNLILNAEGKRIWFITDIVHSDLQFENPNWCFVSDNNEEKAIKTRINVFDELSKPDTMLANSHFIEEAFGYLKKEGEGKYKYEKYNK